MPRLAPIHHRKLIKLFETIGWKYVRTKGDHLIYEKKGFIRPVVIPKYKEIPEFIILKNLKTAGVSRKEYLDLLKKL